MCIITDYHLKIAKVYVTSLCSSILRLPQMLNNHLYLIP